MTNTVVVTADLSAFGSRERRMAAELLTASGQGLPADFEDDGVTLNVNPNSGFVFLSNENYDVAMMNGDKLESFYNCPECGHEGFLEDMPHAGNKGCRDYLDQIGAKATV